MQIIPVIDLMAGQVVHARRGQRDQYRPMVTPLVEGCAPLEIVAAFRALAPFRTLYIADLDAIRRQGDNAPAIRALRAAFPDLELWVDAGEASPEALARRRAADAGTPVIGTESLGPDAARLLAGAGGAVLSLDHDADGPLGPAAVHADPGLWPERVIVMTLAKVGSGEGPDLARIAEVRARKPGARVFGAGGVRGPQDLDALRAAGAAGVLVASALHDGRLPPERLRAFA